MNAIITAVNNASAATPSIRARIWEGTETRVYIELRNASRGRQWLDKGYLRITSQGAADYRAERTLDWRSDDVERFADLVVAELA